MFDEHEDANKSELDWKLIRTLAGGPHAVIPNTLEALVHAGIGAVLMAHCSAVHPGSRIYGTHSHVIMQTSGHRWLSTGGEGESPTLYAVRRAAECGITQWTVLHLEGSGSVRVPVRGLTDVNDDDNENA